MTGTAVPAGAQRPFFDPAPVGLVPRTSAQVDSAGNWRVLDVLIALECSGIFRDAFIALGHNAMSCDLQPTERPGPHYQGDIRDLAGGEWDIVVAHPVCTRLSDSGHRWLHVPPPGRTLEEMWREFEEGVELYLVCRALKARVGKAIENPKMHRIAKERLGTHTRQIVQPHWFGDPFFKGTGWELHGLPRLEPTNKLTPPARGTDDHKRWSYIHRMPPGPHRAKERSRSFPGMAAAAAARWSAYALEVLAAHELVEDLV